MTQPELGQVHQFEPDLICCVARARGAYNDRGLYQELVTIPSGSAYRGHRIRTNTKGTRALPLTSAGVLHKSGVPAAVFRHGKEAGFRELTKIRFRWRHKDHWRGQATETLR